METIQNIIKDQRGLTLVELLVVVAILALLMGIALPTYLGFQDEVTMAATKAELQAIKLGWTYYEMEHSQGALESLDTDKQRWEALARVVPEIDAPEAADGEGIFLAESEGGGYTLAWVEGEIRVSPKAPGLRSFALITSTGITASKTQPWS